MTFEAIREIEDEICSKGSECPFAPYDPVCQSDQDWQNEYSAFCSERLKLLATGDWVKVAENPDLELLREHLFEYIGKNDLQQLSSTERVSLLIAEPKFAEKCKLDDLTGANWAELLVAHPQFADRCPWDKLYGKDWEKLLCSQPQLAGKCSEWWWDRLDWYVILRHQPHFAKDERFVEPIWFTLDVWLSLIANQPLLADICPDMIPWKEWSGSDWIRMLDVQPQFANNCPWEKFDGGGLGEAPYKPSSICRQVFMGNT